MFVVGVMSEALLYLCFSLIMASFILPIIPDSHKPSIQVPKVVLLAAVVGIPFCSLIPILQLVLYIDSGLWQTLQTILMTFEIGQVWLFTLCGSSFLFLFLIMINDEKKRMYSITGLCLTIVLILGVGWSSHARSIQPILGFLIHSIHFLAVTVWIGILLLVSFFSKSFSNWLKFLKWFSPLALLCLLTTIVSGLILMTIVMDMKDYANAWMLPYGQSLLIKHLLVLPLLVYALMNGVLMKKKMKKDPGFDPRPWTRVEGIVILLIFAATGSLGQESPPNNIWSTVTNEGFSSLFSMFYQGQVDPGMSVALSLNGTGLFLFILAVLFMVLSVLSFLRKLSALFSFMMFCLFVMVSYLAILMCVIRV